MTQSLNLPSEDNRVTKVGLFFLPAKLIVAFFFSLNMRFLDKLWGTLLVRMMSPQYIWLGHALFVSAHSFTNRNVATGCLKKVISGMGEIR